MAGIDRAAAPEDQGGIAPDADRGGSQHPSERGPKSETLPEGQNRSRLAGRARSHLRSERQGIGFGGIFMLNDRENVLSALREKPLKVYEVMKRANIPNEEACQSLLLKMRDEGLVKFDIHKGRWQIG